MPPPKNPQLLSLKEEAFVAAYLEHKNATKAARIAYNSKTDNSASVKGFAVLRSNKVRDAIREGYRDRLKASGLTKEWLIARAITIARGSMRHFLDRVDGKLVLKPAEQIADDSLDAILSVKVLKETTTRTMEGDEIERVVHEEVTEIKLHPVGQELDKLFKHFGLYFDASDLKYLREELDRLKAEIAQRKKHEASPLIARNGHSHADA